MDRLERISMWNPTKYGRGTILKCGGRSSMVAFALIITLGAIHVSSAVPVSALQSASDVAPQSANTGRQIEEDKRAAYNFGLGKRAPMPWSAFQRLFDPEMRNFIYTSAEGAKRSKPARFNFGLGKRADETFESQDNSYGGIDDGETDAGSAYSKRAAGRYEFGIGKKRAPATYSRSDFDEYIKRRYAFGLGKR